VLVVIDALFGRTLSVRQAVGSVFAALSAGEFRTLSNQLITTRLQLMIDGDYSLVKGRLQHNQAFQELLGHACAERVSRNTFPT